MKAAQTGTREEIIRKGAELIHARGFNATGLKQVLEAALVPKGSFYFYFKSKEDFGLAVIEYFRDSIETTAGRFLEDDGTPPLSRLSRFFDGYLDIFRKMNFSRGCPIGNLMQEMSDLNEAFRVNITEVYSGLGKKIELLLAEARNRGDLSGFTDPVQLSQFILNAWEGAIMQMKLTKDPEALVIFKKIVFERLLK